MKISTKGRYGLRAMVDICLYQCSAVPLSAIANRQQISEAYLEQLMPKLKKAGLVKSTRGALGGYQLAKDPSDISVGAILRALEGNLNPVACGAIDPDEGCAAADTCVSKIVWQRISESINETVDKITLQELVEETTVDNEIGELSCMK